MAGKRHAPPGAPVSKGGKAPKLTEEQKFLWAEGEQESTNNYGAVNPQSGALGRWQVMPSNLPDWLTDAGQSQMTPQQFIDNHAAQDAVANTILGGYFKEYGAAGAAAMWYSGQPDPNKTYGDPPVDVYVDDVLGYMNDPQAGTGITTTNVPGFGLTPPSPTTKDSWSAQVSNSADSIQRIAVSTHNARDRIHATYHKG
jgi:hypothetical protein